MKFPILTQKRRGKCTGNRRIDGGEESSVICSCDHDSNIDCTKQEPIGANDRQAEQKLLLHDFKSSLTDVQQVWCGYRPENPAKPVLVAVVNDDSGDTKRRPGRFRTSEVVYRKAGDVSKEAKFVAETEITNNHQFSPKDISKIEKCLAENSEQLMKKHSNLQIVSASTLKSRRFGSEDASVEEHACIVLYVNIKGIIPTNEEPFPDTIDGLLTDVRESLFHPCAGTNEYCKELLMGCQISSQSGVSGTLGGFVQLPNGNLGCLTSWHPFASDIPWNQYDIDMYRHIDIYQPCADNQANKIGRVIKAKLDPGGKCSIGIDAALIEITNREPINGNFPDATDKAAGRTLNSNSE